MTVKVLLADDTAVMRTAIRRLLSHEPRIQLVGEADDFAPALSMAHELKPQVLILDLHMPNAAALTPMDVSDSLRADEVAMVAISLRKDEEIQALAECFGALCLIDKMELSQELIPAILKLGSAESLPTSKPGTLREQAPLSGSKFVN
ncbi:MAG: hypothetical protein NVS9B5_34970 [Terriglobales bacterium]